MVIRYSVKLLLAKNSFTRPMKYLIVYSVFIEFTI